MVGSPIWASHVSRPAESYLRQFGRTAKRIGLFVTRIGAPPDTALREMQELSGQAPLATLSVTSEEIATGRYEPPMASFVGKLKNKLEQERQHVA